VKLCHASCVEIYVIVLSALLLSSCSVAVRDKLRQGLDLAFNPVPQAVSPDALAEGRASGLMLFGASLLSYGRYLSGEDETLLQDTYLGCLTCGEFEFDSVFNEQGTYGVAYSRWSIRNSVGQYGGREAFYNLSACNPAAEVPHGTQKFYRCMERQREQERQERQRQRERREDQRREAERERRRR